MTSLLPERLSTRVADWGKRERETREAMSESDLMRRRIITAIVLVAGTITLSWSLRMPVGDPMFIPSTLVLAAVWTTGTFAAGHPKWWSDFSRRRIGRQIGVGLAAGAALAVVFFIGAGIVANIPVLAGPVQDLLAHTKWGALVPVLLVATLNGIVEEGFFRGGLYDAWLGKWAPAITTAAYTLATAFSGVFLLAFAALMLGIVAAVLRRATGGLIAPIVAHLTWSISMILFLDPLLGLWQSLF